ncbi:MAG: hypothetical protein O7C58_02705 [Rickettsia endosymbiont of Ixodes persulcatus]|nr:hypothetical protein [Rickettsia endosymbiont of Ixodes persulcatus]
MSDFTFDKKENYSLDEVESLLKQHRNVVYAESKKDIEPKLSEYQIKLKEYETKVNQYEEKELFNGFNDKQKEISKLLMTSKYKDLPKSDALTKIKTEYSEMFSTNEVSKEEIKVEPKENKTYFNTADLLKLDNIYKNNKKVDIITKAKSKGITTQEERIELVKQAFSEIT